MSQDSVVGIRDTLCLEEQTFRSGDKHWRVLILQEIAKGLPVGRIPMSGLNTVDLVPLSRDMNNFVAHMRRVLDADLSFPIILDDEGYVMDGRHRIARSLLDGEDSILFVRFAKTPDPCFTSSGKD